MKIVDTIRHSLSPVPPPDKSGENPVTSEMLEAFDRIRADGMQGRMLDEDSDRP